MHQEFPAVHAKRQEVGSGGHEAAGRRCGAAFDLGWVQAGQIVRSDVGQAVHELTEHALHVLGIGGFVLRLFGLPFRGCDRGRGEKQVVDRAPTEAERVRVRQRPQDLTVRADFLAPVHQRGPLHGRRPNRVGPGRPARLATPSGLFFGVL